MTERPARTPAHPHQRIMGAAEVQAWLLAAEGSTAGGLLLKTGNTDVDISGHMPGTLFGIQQVPHKYLVNKKEQKKTIDICIVSGENRTCNQVSNKVKMDMTCGVDTVVAAHISQK